MGKIIATVGTDYPIKRMPIYDTVVELHGKPFDWRHLSDDEDQNRDALLRIVDIARAHDVSKVFLPNPKPQNAHIALRDEFSLLPTEISMTEPVVEVYRGPEADGFVIGPGQAVSISTGDCPTLVVANQDRAVLAHCGRECIIGEKSVVNNVLGYFSKDELPDCFAFITGGIAGKHFSHLLDHDVYGKENRERIEFLKKHHSVNCRPGDPEKGCIDLVHVIKEQLMLLGFPSNHIDHDGLDTFTHKDLWSHRGGNAERNLVIAYIPHK